MNKKDLRQNKDLCERIVIAYLAGMSYKNIMKRFDIEEYLIYEVRKIYGTTANRRQNRAPKSPRKQRKWSKEFLANRKKNTEINKKYKEKGGYKQNCIMPDPWTGRKANRHCAEIESDPNDYYGNY